MEVSRVVVDAVDLSEEDFTIRERKKDFSESSYLFSTSFPNGLRAVQIGNRLVAKKASEDFEDLTESKREFFVPRAFCSEVRSHNVLVNHFIHASVKSHIFVSLVLFSCQVVLGAMSLTALLKEETLSSSALDRTLYSLSLTACLLIAERERNLKYRIYFRIGNFIALIYAIGVCLVVTNFDKYASFRRVLALLGVVLSLLPLIRDLAS